MAQQYPRVGSVKLCDSFWSGYLEKIRTVTLPYVFEKLEETGYLENYVSVAAGDGAEHKGPPFSDGLLLESLRGACDFLAARPDSALEAYVDRVIGILAAAQAEDGYLCTNTTQRYPDKRWGDNDGDIVVQHDLYNHGCLIEAAISHYYATGRTTLLSLAVRAANLIVSSLGPAPRKNIVPGHSLPEEAFVKLYRLFRDEPALAGFAAEYGVEPEAYLDMAEFWYDARGDHEGRCLCKIFAPYYNQDHLPFDRQTEAVGHSVRAMLCYLGAAAVAQERGREDYFRVLDGLWESVVYRKLHISGGIGARHDIEGFDEDYHLPNGAYLETCAAIALAFWNGQMNLTRPDSRYFDCFERSLYNNILSAVGGDFRHFFYQNPLESDGSLRRWDWHGCPCCPPMLLKIFSSLSSYIYSFDESTLQVNMLVPSSYEGAHFSVSQGEGSLTVDSRGRQLTLRIRIPEYAQNFTLSEPYRVERGYAVLEGVWDGTRPLTVGYTAALRRNCCDPRVEDNVGRVAVSHGPFVLCAEGIDNAGCTDITLAEDPQLTLEGDTVTGRTPEGGSFRLIPYYRWCNRGEGESDARMAVWLRQQNMHGPDRLAELVGDRLYAAYE